MTTHPVDALVALVRQGRATEWHVSYADGYMVSIEAAGLTAYAVHSDLGEAVQAAVRKLPVMA